MKQAQIINAYKAIERHKKDELPLNISHTLFRLKKQLSEQWEFQIEKEKEIFEKYKAEPQEDGSIKFENQETAKLFSKEIDELANLDTDILLNTYTIKLSENIKFPLEDIEALDAFIHFEE